MDTKKEYREPATADHASVSGSDGGMGGDYRVRDLIDAMTGTLALADEDCMYMHVCVSCC